MANHHHVMYRDDIESLGLKEAFDSLMSTLTEVYSGGGIDVELITRIEIVDTKDGKTMMAVDYQSDD